MNPTLLQICINKLKEQIFIIFQLHQMDQNQKKYFFEANDSPCELQFNIGEFDRKQSYISQSQQLFPNTTQQQRQQQNIGSQAADGDDEESVDHELQRLLLFQKNIQSHPYSRGHHYYCNFDLFERDPDSVSYARDPRKLIKATFSQDDVIIGGTKIKDIVNRIYFTHPINKSTQDRRPRKASNPSRQSLFETEDKKLGFDRSIFTIRHILNNLEQLVYTNKIEQYSILKKDQFLHKIIDPSISISQKRMTLISRLQGLLESRRLSERSWIAQHTINFAPSCNEKFFEQYRIKLNSLSKNILVPFLYNNHFYLKEIVKSPSKDNLYNFIKKVFTFSREQTLSINTQTLVRLSSDFMRKITSNINNSSPVIFPIHIFSFGDRKIIETVNYILARKLVFYTSQFYIMNLLARKMFNSSLVRPEDYIIDDEMVYKLQASKYIEKIREFVKQSQQPVIKNVFIDEQMNYQDLLRPINQIFVLKRREHVQLSGIQYLILMLYHWLCLIVKELTPFINENPQFLQIVSSPNYGTINLSVSQAFKNPLISTLHFCLQQILQYLTESNDINIDTFRLELDFNPINSVGVLWRIENQVKEQSIDEDELNYKDEKKDQQDYDILYFGKRVKSLQGQWV